MSDQSQDETLGDYGGCVSARRVSLETTRMIERAVRERWPIPDEARGKVVNRQVRIATSKRSSPREATSAARCLAAMDSQNLAAEHKAIDKLLPDLVNVSQTEGEQVRRNLADALQAPEYVEYIRQRALAEDTQPSPVCTNGQSRNGHALANGKASVHP
jgi:hypothetical protein